MEVIYTKAIAKDVRKLKDRKIISKVNAIIIELNNAWLFRSDRATNLGVSVPL
jgi:hypothetical protein